MTKEIFDATAMQRALTRITYEIIEKYKGVDNVVLVGIKTRGEFLANRIAKRINELEGVQVNVGSLDISLYRDDTGHKIDHTKKPVINNENIDFSIDDKDVVLVDDVIFTGRTVRSALDALVDQGRPRTISLAVLVDRGHRELPIRPDFIGKNVPTSLNEQIRVKVTEVDDKDSISLLTQE